MLACSLFTAKKLSLLYRFYLNFLLVSMIVTFAIVTSTLIYAFGVSVLVILVWFKILTMAVFAFYLNTYKQHDFYYYHNLGLSKLMLFTSTLGLDFVIFILLMLFKPLIRWYIR
jgi:hypothetical protein